MDSIKVNESLNKLINIKGALSTAIIDWETGITLGTRTNSDFDIDLAAAGNIEKFSLKSL